MDERQADLSPQWLEVQRMAREETNLNFAIIDLAETYGLSIEQLANVALDVACTVAHRAQSLTDRCIDCGTEVTGPDYGDIFEYYNVYDDVWQCSGLGPNDGMLCIGCLESRIGRRLVPEDFSNCLINTHPLYIRSERFTERLNSGKA